ncbi:MAG: vWA domain-containing protein [Solirubrobacteraceae bacterium]
MSDAVGSRLSELTSLMRAAGARVGVDELLNSHRALAAVQVPGREYARLALRAVLCSRHEDLARFEQAFANVFGAEVQFDDGALSELGTIERSVLPRAGFADPSAPGSDRRELSEPVPAAWSSDELLGAKDFASYTKAEYMLARELIARLARRSPMRRSRRLAAARGRGETIDLRRTVRASIQFGGDPVHRRWRSPTMRPRPVVFVCDVSGSMAPYARMLLQYMHACIVARRRVEAFAFATRVTRITHELSGRDHDRALGRAAEAVVDLSGGTRIGAALAELNRLHGRLVGRGAFVVILSDGWDRGDPALLSAEMARLRRSAYRLIWLNPLAADPRFEPLTRGMQAAIPFTDRLLAGNSLDSLGALADALEEL